MSMYSTRSIPRARMYHHGADGRPGSVMGGATNGGFIPDDARSHASGYSMNKAGGVNLLRTRSLVDGQVQPPGGRSVSALSGRGPTYLPPGLHHQFSGAGLSGLSGLNMAGLTGSMGAMAGLPTLSGLGLSRAGTNPKQKTKTDSSATYATTKTIKSTKKTVSSDSKEENLSSSKAALIPEEACSSTGTLSSTTQA